MDNLKIETVTERLFPEKFDAKLTPDQRFSAEVKQKTFMLSQHTYSLVKKNRFNDKT